MIPSCNRGIELDNSSTRQTKSRTVVVAHVVERSHKGRLARGEDLGERELERCKGVRRGARLVRDTADAAEPELAESLVTRRGVAGAVDGAVREAEPDLVGRADVRMRGGPRREKSRTF